MKHMHTLTSFISCVLMGTFIASSCIRIDIDSDGGDWGITNSHSINLDYDTLSAGPISDTILPINGRYNTLRANSAINVIMADSIHAITARGESETLRYLDIRISNGELKMGIKADKGITLHVPITVYIPTCRLEYVYLSGAASLTIEPSVTLNEFDAELSGCSNLKADFDNSRGEISIDLSGASNATISGKFGELDLDLSGSSVLNATGTAREMSADISGASNLEAQDLVATEADIELYGCSSATIDCTRHIEAEVTGASTLRYNSTVKVSNIEESGASTIERY